MYRYQILSDNKILRFITIGDAPAKERQAIVSAKLKHIYGSSACFLKAEIVTEKYYREVSQFMKEKEG